MDKPHIKLSYTHIGEQLSSKDYGVTNWDCYSDSNKDLFNAAADWCAHYFYPLNKYRN